MRRLKDNPNHYKAYLDSREAYPENESGYMPTFHYLWRLMELEPSAVSFFYGGPIGFDGGCYAFYEPGICDDMPLDEITGNEPMQPQIVAVTSLLVYDKPAAARWAGVGIRQIERWMAGNPGKGMEPLRNIKHGRDRFFLEEDLWNYMAKYAVGERWKHVTHYIEGQWIEKFDGPWE